MKIVFESLTMMRAKILKKELKPYFNNSNFMQHRNCTIFLIFMIKITISMFETCAFLEIYQALYSKNN